MNVCQGTMCFGFFVVRYIRYVVTNEQIFPVEKIIKMMGKIALVRLKRVKSVCKVGENIWEKSIQSGKH